MGTLFFWLRVGSIHEKYKSALVITGIVTFIAAYHYFRIFNSWVEAYTFPAPVNGELAAPVMSGRPFNDAYRYMDWLLTVPLLLIEIIFCMNLTPRETSSKAITLGAASALMIILGYPGESIIEGGRMGERWMYWALAMVPFLYVVYTLLVDLKSTIGSEPNPEVRSLLSMACWWTVLSWCTYPFVYLLPMVGIGGAGTVVAIQAGYCVADIISKCGVGFIIYNVTLAKSEALKESLLK